MEKLVYISSKVANREFGKQCQSCFKKGGETFARICYRQTKGIKGKQKDVKKWRRLCSSCWTMVVEGKL